MEQNSRVVLDSSVILAFYSKTDHFHEEAVRIAEDLGQATSFLHPYVIQEVATLLTYRLGVEVAKEFFEDIQRSSNVIIPTVQVAGDIKYFLRINRKMSLTDIALLRLAEEMNATLLTFDRQLLALFRKRQ